MTVVLAAFLKAQHHAVHLVRKELCGQARDGVALVHEGGDVKLVRRREHRVADIAAGADHGVSPKVADDLFRLAGRARHVADRLEVPGDGVQIMAAHDVGHVKAADLIARARDKLHLHLAVDADEKKLTVGHELLESARNRQGGVDMSGGTAAGEDEFHIV